jgi:hypothetical protein
MIPLKLSSHVLPHCIRLCFKEEREIDRGGIKGGGEAAVRC